MRVLKEMILDGDRKVVVREMTVGEIRAWIETKTGGADLVDSTLFEDVAIPDLLFMTDLTADSINSMTPSEINQVIAVIKEVNAGFFEMRTRIVGIGGRIAEKMAAKQQA